MMLRAMRTMLLAVAALTITGASGLLARELDPSKWFEPRNEVEDVVERPSPRARALELAALAEQEEADLEGYENVFTERILSGMPADEIHAILRRYITRYGPVQQVFERAVTSKYGARLEYLLENGVLVPVDLYLSRDHDRRIEIAWIGGAITVENAVGKIVEELKALPGELRLLVQSLGVEGGSSEIEAVTAAHRADEPAGMVYLPARAQVAQLLEAVEAGQLRWDTVVQLDGGSKANRAGHNTIPNGGSLFAGGPAGAQVTVYTAAVLAFSDPGHQAQQAVSDELAALNYPEISGLVEVDTTLGELGVQYHSVIQADSSAGELARGVLLSTARVFPSSAEAPHNLLVPLGGQGVGEENRLERGYLLRNAGGDWYLVAAVWADPLEGPRRSSLERRLERLLELVALLD